MKLYYAETLNPRKACAVARYLDSPVEFVLVDLLRGEHKHPKFLAMNPNGKVPVLQNGDMCLWEANAIMCHLSDLAQSDLWPHDARQIDVLRWLSWDAQHFTPSGGTLYFEYLIKPRIGLGDADPGKVGEAMTNFRTYAHVLDAHLRNRTFLVGDALTVADFAVASALPYAQDANMPIQEFLAITRWYARLEELPAWRQPFPHSAHSESQS